MQYKKLIWWNYKPADEREEMLYRQAYQKAFYFLTTAIPVLAWLYLTLPSTPRAWMQFFFYPRVVGLLLFLVTLMAYFIGTKQVYHEQLQLTVPAKSPFMNFCVMIMVFVSLTILFSIFGDHSYLGQWLFSK